MKNVIALLLLMVPGLALADASVQYLIQMQDYVGVDYGQAVADGKVVNAAEYREMRDLAAGIAAQTAALNPSQIKPRMRAQAKHLARLIESRAPASAITAVTSSMRAAVVREYGVTTVPQNPPDFKLAHRLYAQSCAGCHGASGRGDGVIAAGLEPSPTNFRDAARYRQRTLYGLYNTISLGVDGTAMRAFEDLGEHERWSLAFYVGRLGATAAAVDQGEQGWHTGGRRSALADLETLTTTTPADARQQYGKNAAAVMAYLRAQPDDLFGRGASPLTFTRQQLRRSFSLYRDGDVGAAYQVAVTANLEGFELVESGLDTVDGGLRVSIEDAMTRYRNLLRQHAPVDVVRQQVESLYSLLDDAGKRLRATTVTGGAAFAAAVIILLREGLEALLIVAALMAFLVKTERRDGLPYLHAGWVVALALGVVTWMVSAYLINISGPGRELTEGIAALLAACVLFYLGFWMHDKTHARQWQQFIRGSVQKALGRSTLWGLAGLSFIAVYREVFETVLFYQALWAQTDATGHGMALAGMGAAGVTLAIVAWLILHYSVRLPLRQFFAATGVFMFVLAAILAGNGVAALQEAGKLPISVVPFPRIEILGIYPNLQSLLAQVALVVLALLLIWNSNLRRAARETIA
ncbi:MAG: FTR1 family protein [Gammaproteobacteria bacterium]